MNFDFTVLGSSAAAPTKERNPSSFIINHNKKAFLIDCGEGTQMQFLRYNIKFQKIDHIFISHLHGDHYFGLIGLISTFHLTGRTKPLHIYCHSDLEKVIQVQLEASHSILRYVLIFHFHSFDTKQLIFENTNIQIYSFPLEHGIQCCGFQFVEKPKPRKIIKGKLPHYFSLEQISQLLDGDDILDENGKLLFKNSDLTFAPEVPKSFSYCSDTKVFNKQIEYIKDSTLVYHETTFLDDLKDKAKLTNHSTALQVGKIAEKSAINQLIVGHFSARYKKLSTFISEVQINFKNVELAEEGKTYKI